MPVERYEHIWNNESESMSVSRNLGKFELKIEMTNYACWNCPTDRSFFLSRKEAYELALFILEEVGMPS